MNRLLIIALCLTLMLPLCAERPKIGLVLGGGGAKGAAEVGVLKVLEAAGIHIDYIVGTSIGAVVGGLYAAGYSASELETLIQNQEWLTLLTDRKASLASVPYQKIGGVIYIFGFPIFDKESTELGMISGNRIEHVIDSMAHAKKRDEFDELMTPYCCVAADIRSGMEVILDKGSLARAIRASIAIPGFFKPVKRGDYMLVDGGVLNNLPVDVCRQMGADIVIAVDLQQSDQKPHPQTDFSALTAVADLFGLGPILNWILTRPDIDKYVANRQDADICICPYLPDDDVTSFGNKNAARMIQSGVEAANELLPQLIKLEFEAP